MAADIESVVESRIEEKLAATFPGFDPVIIPTLIELLMDLLSNACGGDDLTPEQAVARVEKLSPFQQAALRSKLTRKAKEKRVRDARRVSAAAADAVQAVAKESTPEERIAFAAYLKPMAGDAFDVF